ncbi:MAG: hypothetical protein JW808_07170 [Victivallales bacterium]|nr:hypothetical protein [Victivallales bacterium]
MNNTKPPYFVFVSLFAAFFSCVFPIFAQEDEQGWKVSRSENVPGAFDDSLSLDNVVDVLKDRKTKENAGIVKKLGKDKVNAVKEGNLIKKKIKAAHSDPKRFNKLTGGTGAKPATHAQKAYLTQELSNNAAKTKKIDQKVKAVNQDTHKTNKGHQRYGKASKVVGSVGKVLSVYDAYQNSYEKGKDGKKVFSKTKFFKNAVMNLSGVTGLSSAYTLGMEAKEKAFLKSLDEYEKAGMDITDPEIIYKALAKATGKALLVGAYEGAKCIPLAGDAINVYELTESSVGLVHDTLESNRIREENKQEQDRQAGASIAKFKAILSQARSCRNLYDKQVEQSKNLAGQFKKIRDQYVAVQNRDVKRKEKLADTDKIEKACKVAGPFLEPRYLQSLKDNSRELDRAAGATLKLAETTLDNHSKNPDKAPLKHTGDELAEMLKTLLEYKEEFDKVLSVLQPLIGGNAVIDQSSALEQAAIEDALISANLMSNADDLVELHRSTVLKCQKLQTAQRQVKAQFDNAYNYFSIHSKDMGQHKRINDLKNEMIGVMINDYELKGLNEDASSMAADIKYWHEPIRPAEGMDPELAGIVVKAAETISDVAPLRDSLANRIEDIKAMIDRLENPDTMAGDSPSYADSKIPGLSENQLANVTLDQLCGMIVQNMRNRKISHPDSVVCGYKVYKPDSEEGKLISYNNYDACAKLAEKGTTRIIDYNGVKKTVPYSIWFMKELSWTRANWLDYHHDFGYEDNLKRDKTNSDISEIRVENAEYAFIGIRRDSKAKIHHGRAYNRPFSSEVQIFVRCRVGDHLIFASNIWDTSQDSWGNLLEKEKIQGRMEHWMSRVDDEIIETLNANLALPAKLVQFTEKNFYRDVDPLFVDLPGFAVKKEGSTRNSSSRYYTKEWDYGSKHKGKLSIKISICARFPKNDESWNSFLKSMPEYIGYDKRDSDFNLAGADFARMHWKDTPGQLRIGSQNIATHGCFGHLLFTKQNIHVSIWVHEGSRIPSSELISMTDIAQSILSKLKK